MIDSVYVAIAGVVAAILIGGAAVGLLARRMDGKKVLPF